MQGAEESAPYAVPRVVGDISDCYFYHTIEIPGHGVVQGEWDLRPGVDAYLGGFDFRGKRVLDVGAASGFLSFHTELNGADVVSFDLSEDQPWDIVPFARGDAAAVEAGRRDHMRRINNSYWFCHRAFNSHAKAVYGTVYEIPLAIGPVDVAIYGSILLHLRDPFRALEMGARLTREAIIVSDLLPYGRFGLFRSAAVFMPRFQHINDWFTWWRLPPSLVCEFLKILGFEHTTVTRHRQLFCGKSRTLYTVIGRRA
jgi:SAM-dependent methyltransferase